MPTLTRIALKDFNPAKLFEEMASLPLAGNPGMAGFDRVTARRFTPAPGVKLVGTQTSTGATVQDFAQPGELRLPFTRDLTGPETTALDNAITAHVHTVLTAEQTREDQDDADFQAILSTERTAYVQNLTDIQAAIDAWDAQTTAQRLAATKQHMVETRECLLTVGKVLRLFLRRERDAAI